MERASQPRAGLTAREIAEVRQMLVDYRQTLAQFEMIKHSCPVARNVFRTGD